MALVTGGLVKDQNTAGDLNVYNHSTLNMTSGTVNYELISHDTVALNVSGGSVGNVSGGSVGPARGTLYAEGSSTANVSGGAINFVSGYENSTVTISGGSFAQNSIHGAEFYDDTTGAFTFVGTGLSATFLSCDSYFQGNKYLLAGVLQGGQDIAGRVIALAGGAKMFTLAAPEPSQSAALAVGAFGLGALALKARRHTRTTPPNA